MGASHPLRIFAGTANCELAEDVSRILKCPLGKCTTTRLPDSEIHVSLDEVVRDQDVFIIQPCSVPVNDNLMELLLYVDAFRRASAHEITAVIPYYPYGRQERMAKGREAISARVVATMLETIGVSRVIYFDVHAPAIQGFFRVPVDPLSALPVMATRFQGPEFRNAAIVSPDVGRAKLAGKFAEMLGLPLVVMHKRRTSPTKVEPTHVVGDIQGKTPIVIDDVIAGGSVLDEVNWLLGAGARPEVHFAITHGVLLPSALERLERNEAIKKLVISDTIAQPDRVRSNPKIEVISVADLLADAIDRIHNGVSISSLIEKALA